MSGDTIDLHPPDDLDPDDIIRAMRAEPDPNKKAGILAYYLTGLFTVLWQVAYEADEMVPQFEVGVIASLRGSNASIVSYGDEHQNDAEQAIEKKIRRLMFYVQATRSVGRNLGVNLEMIDPDDLLQAFAEPDRPRAMRRHRPHGAGRRRT